MQLTVTPCGPSSQASERVRPTTPCLLAVYGEMYGVAPRPSVDAMFTMRPAPSRIEMRQARLDHAHVAGEVHRQRQIATRLRSSSAPIGAGRLTPAQFTRTSIGPSVVTAAPTTARTWRASVTSSCVARGPTARVPDPRHDRFHADAVGGRDRGPFGREQLGNRAAHAARCTRDEHDLACDASTECHRRGTATGRDRHLPRCAATVRLRVLAAPRRRPRRRTRPGTGAHRHRRRRARARPVVDAARGPPVAHRGRPRASARRLLGALRLPAARGGGLRGARLLDPLPQQRHRLPPRGRRAPTSPLRWRGSTSEAPTRSCCSATAAAVR